MPPPNDSSASASTSPGIFCKSCGYALVGLLRRICPECGRAFDPANRRTFARKRPGGLLWRWARRVMLLMLLLFLAAGAGVFWLWWGWHAEQPTIAQLRMLKQQVRIRSIGPEKLRWVLGDRLGYLTDRVDRVFAVSLKANETERLDFRALSHIRQVAIIDCELSNPTLSNLHDLQELSSLSLANLKINKPDLTFLEKLPALSTLQLSGKWAAEAGFEHLAGLKHLKDLYLSAAGVTDADLQQLRDLSSLQEMNLTNNLISGAALEHLEGLKSLHILIVDERLLDSSGVAKLKYAIPRLEVHDQKWLRLGRPRLRH